MDARQDAVLGVTLETTAAKIDKLAQAHGSVVQADAFPRYLSRFFLILILVLLLCMPRSASSALAALTATPSGRKGGAA